MTRPPRRLPSLYDWALWEFKKGNTGLQCVLTQTGTGAGQATTKTIQPRYELLLTWSWSERKTASAPRFTQLSVMRCSPNKRYNLIKFSVSEQGVKLLLLGKDWTDSETLLHFSVWNILLLRCKHATIYYCYHKKIFNSIFGNCVWFVQAMFKSREKNGPAFWFWWPISSGNMIKEWIFLLISRFLL